MSGRQRTRVPAAAPTAAAAVSAGLLALLLAAAAACAGDGPAAGPGRAAAGDPDRPSPAAAPRRIVSMSPNLTEILFALGLGERVVGVDDFSDHPPEAAAKPRLGGFVDPDLERIVTLRPDLAVMLESQAELARELERLGIEVLRVDNQDLEDVAESMVAIGRRAGFEARGAALARDFRAALAPRPVADGERVMVAVGRTPGSTGEVMVAGPGSYPYEMVARLGAENVFADLGSRYATVGAEEVVARAPERVLELHWLDLDAAAEAAMAEDWRRLLGPDVEVSVVDGPAVVVPGPRLPAVYDRLEAALR
jgi:iron complex transport system substrate-binding protein